jgi:hypothetical protein
MEAEPSRTLARVVGVMATAALLGVAIAATALVLKAVRGHDENGAALRPAAAPTATPTTEPKPRPRPLSARERAARRAAADIVRSQGFEPLRLADWRPRQTLRVLVGRQSGGTARRAFFFVGDRYVGNDTAEPSARVRVATQRSRRITLVYDRYEPGDRPCCPKGGVQRVRFEWDGTALRPLDAIPPAAARTAPAA